MVGPVKRYLRSFEEIGIEDVALVGGKTAALGELYRKLTLQGVHVPNGFAITAEAYRYVLTQAGAWGPLRDALDGLKPDDLADLARRGRRERHHVLPRHRIRLSGCRADQRRLRPRREHRARLD